jgi:hypothetical protein
MAEVLNRLPSPVAAPFSIPLDPRRSDKLHMCVIYTSVRLVIHSLIAELTSNIIFYNSELKIGWVPLILASFTLFQEVKFVV